MKNLHKSENGSNRLHMRTAHAHCKRMGKTRLTADLRSSAQCSVYQAKEPKFGLQMEFYENAVHMGDNKNIRVDF